MSEGLRPRRFSWAGLLIAAALTLTVRAAAQSDSPEPNIRISVDFGQTDVVVTDHAGHSAVCRRIFQARCSLLDPSQDRRWPGPLNVNSASSPRYCGLKPWS